MWFFLRKSINKKDTFVTLNGSYDKLSRYFFSDIEDEKYIVNVKFSGVAQKGFTHQLLAQADYLENSRFGGIPLFSQRFMERTKQYLSGKIDFHPCQILLNDVTYVFYLGRIKCIKPIIDYEKSGYRILTDGSRILSEPKVIKASIDEKMLIVRDATYKSTFVVSELFKQMVEKEKLKVGFDNTSSTFW